MHDWHESWDKAKTVSGITLIVCLCLYAIRCAMTFHVVSLNQFDRFMRGLLRYIFA